MSQPLPIYSDAHEALASPTGGAPRPTPFNPATPNTSGATISPQTLYLQKPRGPIWPHHLPERSEGPALDHWPKDVARLLVDFRNDVVPLASYTPSQLQSFATCPRQFAWKHEYGLRHGRILDMHVENLERTRVTASRGRNLHRFFELHRDGWSEAKMRDVLCDTIARLTDCPLSHPEQYVDEFLLHVRRFLESEQYALLRTADEVLRECAVNVDFPGQPGFELSARLDVVYRRAGLWYVIDYKTADFSTSSTPLHDILEDTTRHELQAALYLLALRRVYGKHFVGNFTYFYTSCGVAVQEEPSEAWLDGWEALLPSMVRWIQKHNFGEEHPKWSSLKCGGCDLRNTVCRPVGDPRGTALPALGS